MEWVDKAKYIFQITCMFCKENRKIVSTFVLFLITLVIIVIGVVLHIPSDVDKNSFTPRPPLFSNIKFTPFSLNVSQLEFLLSTCEYYACIEDTCYCKTAEKFTWHQAKETCENSGLPNAAMFKPLTVRHGVFHTYKNLLTFLTNSGGYHKPLWTSLHREKEVSFLIGWNHSKLLALDKVRKSMFSVASAITRIPNAIHVVTTNIFFFLGIFLPR